MSLNGIVGADPNAVASNATKESALIGNFDGVFNMAMLKDKEDGSSSVVLGFSIPTEQQVKFANVQLPLDLVKTKQIDRNGTFFDAMKVAPRTMMFLSNLYNVGAIAGIDENGEVKLKRLSRCIGNKVRLNCGINDAGYPTVNIARGSGNVEIEQTKLENVAGIENELANIPDSLIAWTVNKIRENEFVTLTEGNYLVRIASYKEKPAAKGRAASHGFTLMCYNKESKEFSGRIYVSFRMNVAEDVQRLQKLVKMVGTDEVQMQNVWFIAMISELPLRAGGTMNILEEVFKYTGEPPVVVKKKAAKDETDGAEASDTKTPDAETPATETPEVGEALAPSDYE